MPWVSFVPVRIQTQERFILTETGTGFFGRRLCSKEVLHEDFVIVPIKDSHAVVPSIKVFRPPPPPFCDIRSTSTHSHPHHGKGTWEKMPSALRATGTWEKKPRAAGTWEKILFVLRGKETFRPRGRRHNDSIYLPSLIRLSLECSMVYCLRPDYKNVSYQRSAPEPPSTDVNNAPSLSE